MGSTAWNADGDVPVRYSIPWGAVRKGWLHYLGNAMKVAKITLNGIVFDVGKQAKEGLVVVGNGYSSVTFFLPDDKAAMTVEDGAAMSIYDYLEMLGTTDYSVITAWDYFAAFVGDTVRNMMENSETDVTALAYSFSSASGVIVNLEGTADFSTITTAKEFFNTIFLNLDVSSQTSAKASPLSGWMDSDGTVLAEFVITLGEDNKPAFPLYIGRK